MMLDSVERLFISDESHNFISSHLEFLFLLLSQSRYEPHPIWPRLSSQLMVL